MDFKDRQGQNLNRKKIKIISQSPTEIIADIERCDTVTEEGNLINASTFNTFQKEIDQANANASSALNISSEASNNINDAKDYASEALIKAKNAIADSKKAIDLATETANSLSDRGTTIYVGNKPKPFIEFDSDPQGQLDNKIEKAKTTSSTFSDNDLIIVQNVSSNVNYNITLKTLTETILNVTYPVGSIYISISSTNPGNIFGGTWEQINDKFLLSAGTSYAAGTQGGEATHILTAAEIPSHIHNNAFQVINLTQEKHRHRVLTYTGHTRAGINNIYSPCSTSSNLAKYFGLVGNGANNFANNGTNTQQNTHSSSCGYSDLARAGSIGNNTEEIVESSQPKITFEYSFTNMAAGGGQSHNNMPPYLVVYMWKRVS